MEASDLKHPPFRVLTFRDGVRASRLKVWCPKQRRLLTWREVRALRRAAIPAAASA